MSWLYSKPSQPCVVPSQRERTNQEAYRCHACLHRSQPVSDAGALAPVVFSGEDERQTCKTRHLKAKERSCPPKSDLLSSLVALVLIESAWIGSFESHNLESPSNGILRFLRETLHVMHLTHFNEYPELK